MLAQTDLESLPLINFSVAHTMDSSFASSAMDHDTDDAEDVEDAVAPQSKTANPDNPKTDKRGKGEKHGRRLVDDVRENSTRGQIMDWLTDSCGMLATDVCL